MSWHWNGCLSIREHLRRLRSGPIGKLLEGFCSWLLEHGFRRGTTRKHLFNLSHLNEYLGGPRSVVRQTVSLREVEGFFRAYSLQCRHRRALEEYLRRLGYSVNRFLAYLRESGFLDSLPRQEIYQPLLDGYLQWMRHYQHASEGTLTVRSHSITQFLRLARPRSHGRRPIQADGPENRSLLSELCPEHGEIRTALHAVGFADLLAFLFASRLYGATSRPRGSHPAYLQTGHGSPRPERPPSPTGPARASTVTATAGRRDYAILQLLYTYGVRGGQVRALRLEDIDWAQNQILFKASKQGKDSRLPLTAQVGESLLDYLQNSRPPYSYPHVFLTCRAPYHPLAHSSSLSAIVERHHPGCGHRAPQQGRTCLSAWLCHPHAPSGSFAEGNCRRARPSPSQHHLHLYQGRF